LVWAEEGKTKGAPGAYESREGVGKANTRALFPKGKGDGQRRKLFHGEGGDTQRG